MPKNNGTGQSTIISEKDLNKMYTSLVTARDIALFNLLRYTGERGGAIVQLKWDDINFSQDWLVYQGDTRKGGKSRALPLHRILKASLKNWKAELAVIEPLNGYVFPSNKGTKGHLTYDGLYDWCRKLFKKHRLELGGYSVHSFRRTFITQLHNKGYSVKEMQKLTGHRDVKSLLDYVDVTGDKLEQMISSL